MGIFADAFIRIPDSFSMVVIDLSQKRPACWGGKFPLQLKPVGSRFPAFLLAQNTSPQIAAKIGAGERQDKPVGDMRHRDGGYCRRGAAIPLNAPPAAAIEPASAEIQGRRRRFKTADLMPTAERLAGYTSMKGGAGHCERRMRLISQVLS
jgi:hypothetical protein